MSAEGKRGKTSPLFELARVLVRCVCCIAKHELGAELKRRNVRRGNVTNLSQSSVSAHRRAVHRKSDQRRVDTRFRLLKYCSRNLPSLDNFSSPTLRFGEVLDFSLSFCVRHPAAWPAAFQITCKNNAESSLVELLCDVFSKNFQSSKPFVWFLMFISLHECGIAGLSQVFIVWHTPFISIYGAGQGQVLRRHF